MPVPPRAPPSGRYLCPLTGLRTLPKRTKLSTWPRLRLAFLVRPAPRVFASPVLNQPAFIIPPILPLTFAPSILAHRITAGLFCGRSSCFLGASHRISALLLICSETLLDAIPSLDPAGSDPATIQLLIHSCSPIAPLLPTRTLRPQSLITSSPKGSHRSCKRTVSSLQDKPRLRNQPNCLFCIRAPHSFSSRLS